jgi:hypothetical protein
MLAQADGIAHDTFGNKIPNFSIYTKGKVEKAIKNLVVEFAKEALLGSAIIKVVLLPLPLNASENNPMRSEKVLNRHAILHGTNTTYATPLNSCRAISWLDYVSYFHKVSSKRRNKLNQGGSGGRGQ